MNAPDIDAPARRPAQKFGRYDVLGSIGAGGMGEVFLAYDAQLHRRVAIKALVKTVASPQNERLLREAQTLAQLSHPNLVHLYEVGEYEGGVFLVMEYIEGPSLSAWLHAQRRPWRQVLEVFIGAGTGLAAAHRAGIVHRDFKPANVIIGRDGAARVLDFGIAVLEDALAGMSEMGDTRVRDRAAALQSTLTEHGVVLGTLPYMAPEQLVGIRGDARSDQYSFAIALFEAIYRVRPFPDERAAAAAAKLQGAVEFPRADGVPRHLRTTLRRALSTDPAHRFESMEALLAALDQARGRRRLWLGVAAGAAAGAAAYAWLAPRTAAGECDVPPASITDAWSEERREAVRTAFSSIETDYAAASLRLVHATIDRYVERWVEIWRASCEATIITHTQSQELFDLRMGCLERALDQLAATVEVVATADGDAVRNAAELMARVSSIEPCTDDDALRDELPPPESQEQRLQIERVRSDLERARVQLGAGRFAAALERVREVVVEADAIGYEPLRAEAYHALGEALEDAPKQAEAAYREAMVAAGTGRHDAVGARSAVALVHVVGVTQARLAEAESLMTAAEAAIARVEDVGLSAELAGLRGSIASAAGRYEDAIAAYREGEELLRRVAGPDDPRLRVFYNNLGVVLLLQGQLDLAQEKFEEALAAGERSVGADHPDIADYVMNIGNVLMERRDGLRAKAMFERASTLLGRDPAQNRRRLAILRSNIAYAEALLGDLDAAERDATLAQQELSATLGTKHPHVAGTLDLLAHVALQRGDLDAATRHVDAADAITVAALGDKHPLSCLVRVRRAEVLIERGESAAAAAVLETTVASLSATFDEAHPDVAAAAALLAEARLGDDPDAAAAHLEAAIPHLRPLDHHVVGRAKFAWARAQWSSPRSRGAALEHARAALEEFGANGDVEARDVREWLAPRQ